MRREGKRPRSVVLVSTVPYFMVAQLGAYIHYLLKQGIRVTVITSQGRELDQLQRHDALTIVPIQIPRKLDLWHDIRALVSLYLLFQGEAFDLLHSTTPKAGLLCAIAAKVSNIPVRLHTFTGQAWATKTGVMRAIMRWSDMLVVKLMTHCYADSHSQRDFLVKQGIARDGEISVVGYGSLGGVDTKRFSVSHWDANEKKKLRAQLGISSTDVVMIYIGRITGDKGIGELLDAFSSLQQDIRNTHLLLLGPTDRDGAKLSERAVSQMHVHSLGFHPDPERFLAISDVLCLPSYREGFGTVIIEGAAMGIPAIGTTIPGLVDAIEDGVSGILVPPSNTIALQKAMEALVKNPSLRKRMGYQAHKRARSLFAADVLGSELLSVYEKWWEYIPEIPNP